MKYLIGFIQLHLLSDENTKNQLMMLMKIICNIFSQSDQNSEDVDPRKILEAVKELPKEILKILKEWLSVLILILYFVGALLVIFGIIEWATSYNESEGKRYVVRGFIMILLALLISV